MMADGAARTLVVMTKAPMAGRSKTRLCPPLTPAQAAAVAEAALIDTLAAVAASSATRTVIALEGEPGSWLPEGFEVIEQRGGGLDERLAAAFATVAEPAVIIAMDTPQVTPAQIDRSLAALGSFETVLGPTTDGGYWCIGLRATTIDPVTGVPMSRTDTMTHQQVRIAELGLSCSLVDELIDVDDIDDARAVARLIPDSAFARCLGVAMST